MPTKVHLTLETWRYVTQVNIKSHFISFFGFSRTKTSIATISKIQKKKTKRHWTCARGFESIPTTACCYFHQFQVLFFNSIQIGVDICRLSTQNVIIANRNFSRIWITYERNISELGPTSSTVSGVILGWPATPQFSSLSSTRCYIYFLFFLKCRPLIIKDFLWHPSGGAVGLQSV